MTEVGGVSPPLAEVLALSARVFRAFMAGRSLDRALAEAAIADGSRLRAAVQDVSYTAVRRRALSERVIAELAGRPPSDDVRALLAVALPQLLTERHAAYAVVDQTVTAARANRATAFAAGFVNALLRNFLRQQSGIVERLNRDDVVNYNAPSWWIDQVRAAEPQQWRTVLAAGSSAPPLVVRVNSARVAVNDYLRQLSTLDVEATQVGEQAVWLHEPRAVAQIPGFADGTVSVQDAGAQLAAPWLDVEAGMRVLDACAAPGGKTGHLAELAALELTAIEADAARARRISDNLARIGRQAQVLVADARDTSAWWDGSPFDRILLDAPCTGSGVVRRHPDIPWVRRKADVAHLATLQRQFLEALWPLLGVGGRLLYVVCSVFPEEGREQVERMVGRLPGAAVRPLPGGSPMVLLLPSASGPMAWDTGQPWPTLHDGFFYALLEKSR
jgi:16S rRNA (cytosine967-C5)-methyltransferase